MCAFREQEDDQAALALRGELYTNGPSESCFESDAHFESELGPFPALSNVTLHTALSSACSHESLIHGAGHESPPRATSAPTLLPP